MEKGIIRFANPVTDITELFDYEENDSAINLTSFVLPNSLDTIGVCAFCGCLGLESITISDNIKVIDKGAFSYCNGIKSITFGKSVTTIGDSCFRACTSLTEIIIPDSVRIIGSSAFDGCYKLTTITLPQSLTSIGTSAFYSCVSLTTITIPKLVTTINNGWITNTNIKTVILEPTTPPYLESRGAIPTIVDTIYVPAESVDAYKSATVWSQYADKIQAIPT